jgi:hydrogenase expression/formation protein HypE
MNQVSVIPEALALAESGASSMHDVTRGGVLEALLEIANLSDIAIEVDEARLPIPKIVSRFSQAFEFNPLKMISSGTLVATLPPSKLVSASQTLQEMQIPYADIGLVISGSGVLYHKRDGSTRSYIQLRAEQDELSRMWARYPR